ncbi:MAG: WbqC family protein [bacterium]
MIYSIHQPHYLPYPGYLAKVALSDAFVFLEGVQYVRREWQNRNRVKGPNGAVWLTVPVSGDYGANIRDIRISMEENWKRKHMETLRRFYAKAEHGDEVENFLALLDHPYDCLSALTIETTSFFFNRFAIATSVRTMRDLEPLPEEPNDRIIAIGQRLGADVYLAGSGGRSYMDIARFERAGINVRFMNFPEIHYPQLHGTFIPNLGAIDLLANCGTGGFDRYVRPHIENAFSG